MAPPYTLSQIVEVHSFGRWYSGCVLKLGRTRVQVRYTAGKGATRNKWFTSDLVRPVAYAPRCGKCRGTARMCQAGDPDCLHCDSCGWCGNAL